MVKTILSLYIASITQDYGTTERNKKEYLAVLLRKNPNALTRRIEKASEPMHTIALNYKIVKNVAFTSRL